MHSSNDFENFSCKAISTALTAAIPTIHVTGLLAINAILAANSSFKDAVKAFLPAMFFTFSALSAFLANIVWAIVAVSPSPLAIASNRSVFHCPSEYAPWSVANISSFFCADKVAEEAICFTSSRVTACVLSSSPADVKICCFCASLRAVADSAACAWDKLNPSIEALYCSTATLLNDSPFTIVEPVLNWVIFFKLSIARATLFISLIIVLNVVLYFLSCGYSILNNLYLIIYDYVI